MKTWITADWHLGESRMNIMHRPFNGSEQMTETLLGLHNKVVAPNDNVIIVGDVCNQKAPEMLSFVSNFNGVKILIRGNHDQVFSDEELSPYFKEIITEGCGIEVTINDILCYITHYPTRGKKDRFNLVGHIHSAWKYQLNMMNIGVDVHHFRPVDLDTIPFHYEAICKYYDDDVWSAYDDINMDYRVNRGKSGTYL